MVRKGYVCKIYGKDIRYVYTCAIFIYIIIVNIDISINIEIYVHIHIHVCVCVFVYICVVALRVILDVLCNCHDVVLLLAAVAAWWVLKF